MVTPSVSTTSAANCLVAPVAMLKEVSGRLCTWMEMVAGEQVMKGAATLLVPLMEAEMFVSPEFLALTLD